MFCVRACAHNGIIHRFVWTCVCVRVLMFVRVCLYAIVVCSCLYACFVLVCGFVVWFCLYLSIVCTSARTSVCADVGRHIPLYTANVRMGHRTCLHMSTFELLEVGACFRGNRPQKCSFVHISIYTWYKYTHKYIYYTQGCLRFGPNLAGRVGSCKDGPTRPVIV